MAITAKIDVEEKDILESLRGFFRDILNVEEIKAVLVPQHLPMKNMVMPTLVTDLNQLDGVDPLAPAFPMNAAKIVSRLTRKPMGGKIAAALRPCEIRAFFELVKLKQGSTDELVLIGIDCLGAYQNNDYSRFVEQNGDQSTIKFYQNILSGKNGEIDGLNLAPACKACEYPVASNADILIGLYGIEVDSQILIQSQTNVGEDLLAQLNLSEINEPGIRQDTVADVIEKRVAYRDEMFGSTREVTDSLEKMTAYLASCVNCYNCRVACPVCYCKECVFVTDVFNHDPSRYLRWANRKGIIKMPTDTVFYHITRLAHMSTACVGCGQCSNACPNDIPVMELFRTVSQRTQEAFEYEAGRSLEEDPPLSVFREEEFPEVVGIN
ncbi:MAG: 4Fe-4S dicluster domain-containing protein [Desulfobacterales bacterium]|nr:MAG: 4Fe-4S dicluster domain-containing protein [Desulfobacterales bacterium]